MKLRFDEIIEPGYYRLSWDYKGNKNWEICKVTEENGEMSLERFEDGKWVTTDKVEIHGLFEGPIMKFMTKEEWHELIYQ